MQQNSPFECRYNGQLGDLPVRDERVRTASLRRAISLVGCVDWVASALHRHGAQISILVLQFGLTIARKLWKSHNRGVYPGLARIQGLYRGKTFRCG
jgi:hypothetical protein